MTNGTSSADDKIRNIIQKQQTASTLLKPATTTTDDELKRRLLAQYSHVEEDEEEWVSFSFFSFPYENQRWTLTTNIARKNESMDYLGFSSGTWQE